MSDQPAAQEDELLREAQEGNAEAFGDLYERYGPPVFRFLYAHLENRLDAEDLTEEVFLRAWRALPQYRQNGVPFSAFLFRIARNALIDHYRTNGKARYSIEIEQCDLPDPQPGPADRILAEQECDQLRRTMQHLKDEYHTVLIARFISNLSTEETAEMMGKSPGAVRVLQHRALAALRKLLEEIKV